MASVSETPPSTSQEEFRPWWCSLGSVTLPEDYSTWTACPAHYYDPSDTDVHAGKPSCLGLTSNFGYTIPTPVCEWCPAYSQAYLERIEADKFDIERKLQDCESEMEGRRRAIAGAESLQRDRQQYTSMRTSGYRHDPNWYTGNSDRRQRTRSADRPKRSNWRALPSIEETLGGAD